MIRILGIVIFFFIAVSVMGQDKILLMNGKILNVKNISLKGYTVAYRTSDKNKLKQIDTERIFSIQYADETERVVFSPNSADPLEYTVDQMRMYVKGEQDATLYYKNNWNKVFGFAAGVGSSFLGFYGIIGPAVYGALVGEFSPNMAKQTVSDKALLANEDYCEGYKSKARSRKVRNGIISGFIGFAAGVAVLSIK
jgi:hypothetical protein